ncbi:MAG: hydroxymethylglutaryl-CoA reductase, partial [Winogradskyella sp.]|nr:hydroxymethylglutaryl-CoA reductase [Winogradskyella sp.]
MPKTISGFSKLSKSQKIDWILDTYFLDPKKAKQLLSQYWNSNDKLQKLHDEFIENTVTNYYLPLGVAPNFNINGRLYTIPMVIEESSVVAAASKAAKFWEERGGFKAQVISTTKIGQVHFLFNGSFDKLKVFFDHIKQNLFKDTNEITKNMRNRGGGILDIELRDKSSELANYYQ